MPDEPIARNDASARQLATMHALARELDPARSGQAELDASIDAPFAPRDGEWKAALALRHVAPDRITATCGASALSEAP